MKEAIGAALIVAVGLLIVWTGVSTPVVQKSHSDGACVAVIPETAGDCDDKPSRYTKETVK